MYDFFLIMTPLHFISSNLGSLFSVCWIFSCRICISCGSLLGFDVLCCSRSFLTSGSALCLLFLEINVPTIGDSSEGF